MLTEVYISETGALGWDAAGRRASLSDFSGSSRDVGSIFEALKPGEGILLQEGVFVLDGDLDPIALRDFAGDLYAEMVWEPSFQSLIEELSAINPGFAQAILRHGLGMNLIFLDSGQGLFDFESGALFEDLPAEWQSWIASDAPGRDEAYGLCADWAMRFASEIFRRIK